MITGEMALPTTTCPHYEKLITQKGLNRHIREKHGDQKSQFPCDSCEYTTSRKMQLLDHQRRVHLLPKKKWTTKEKSSSPKKSSMSNEVICFI